MTGGYIMKEKNIRELAKHMGLVTVEDMCQYTIAQLVVMVANKVNELINEVWRFETDVQETLKTQNENIQYLLGEGLHLEVATVFEGWMEDGTFDTLINQTALKKVNERIDETNKKVNEHIDETNTQLSDIIDNDFTRKLKQPFYMSTFFISIVSLAEMKQMLDEFKVLGVDGIIQPIHIAKEGSEFVTEENIDNIVKALEYSESINLPVKYIKFHTNSVVTSDSNFYTSYRNKIESVMARLSKFTKNIYVFNENMLTTTNPTECGYVIDRLKNNYKVGISFHGPQFIDTPRSLIDKLDYIGFNLYPSFISFNGRKTMYSECVNAFENDRNMQYLKMVIAQYKGFIPIHITESGIRDYYVYYASPASYNSDSVGDKSNGEVIANYFNALFEVWNGEVESITGWFYIYFDKSIKTFKSWTGGAK